VTSSKRRPPDRVVIEPGERRGAVVDLIRHARSRVALSLFRCNDQAVFDALERATRRGVTVEVLMTSRSASGRKKLRKLRAAIEATGASVHVHRDRVVKYHAKYLIADDGPALVTSLNFTRRCFSKTIDGLVITHDPAVVAGLRELMAADRDGRTIPDRLPARLIVGPERARRQLTAIVEQAQSSIRIIDAKISDPAVLALLRERQRTGVHVELYEDKRMIGLRSHGKIMLVDGRLGIVGGLALNAMSLDFRREVALVVEEPSAVEEIARLFDSLGAPAAAAVERPVAEGGST
jgi:phosphatidylserine/phosphatidylglycerophosphate/cardiolipin synthase-like enzyme